ncbi:hypothetical protein KY342_05230 [Candidatus Woesearchaeota archaeon]|nr:hypothetical protein [Candidatus Woesearchaeota archaeon]
MRKKFIEEDNTTKRLEEILDENIQKLDKFVRKSVSRRVNYEDEYQASHLRCNLASNFSLYRIINYFNVAPRYVMAHISDSQIAPDIEMVLCVNLLELNKRSKEDHDLVHKRLEELFDSQNVQELPTYLFYILFPSQFRVKSNQSRLTKFWKEMVRRSKNNISNFGYLGFHYIDTSPERYPGDLHHRMAVDYINGLETIGYRGICEGNHLIKSTLKRLLEIYDKTPFGGRVAILLHSHNWSSPPRHYIDSEGHPQNRD